MKARLLTVGLLLGLLCGVTMAGEAKYVGLTSLKDLDLATLYFDGFWKPLAGTGTVHPGAIVSRVAIGSATYHLAIDATDANAPRPNVVRFDVENKHSFADAVVIPLQVTDEPGGFSATFGPQVIQLPCSEGTIPVTIEGTYSNSGSRMGTIQVGCAMEGTVSLGGKDVKVRFIDRSGFLTCTQKARPRLAQGRLIGSLPGDLMAVDVAGNDFQQDVQVLYYGQPVVLDGKCYAVKVSSSRQIEAASLDAPTAQVQVNADTWQAVLVSKERVLRLSGGKAPVTIPAGEYSISTYRITAAAEGAKSGAEQPAITYQSGTPDRGDLEMTKFPAGQVTQLNIGPPLSVMADTLVQADEKGAAARLAPDDRKGGPMVLVQLVESDPAGRRVHVSPRSTGPSFTILDADGKTVGSGKMAYG